MANKSSIVIDQDTLSESSRYRDLKIKDTIYHTDDHNLPKTKEITHFDQKKFLDDMRRSGIKVTARNISD